MATTLETKDKNERMYREIRFQRNSSKALKPDHKLFRLKQGSRNLQTTDYAENLCSYLEQSRVIQTLTMSDLRNVLVGLNGSNVDNAETASINSETESTLNLGEHIACVWYDDTLNKNHSCRALPAHC